MCRVFLLVALTQTPSFPLFNCTSPDSWFYFQQDASSQPGWLERDNQKETPGFGATSLPQGILPRSTRPAAWVHLPCSGLVFFRMNSPCARGDPLCHLSSLWRWGNPGRTGACCRLWLGASLVDSVAIFMLLMPAFHLFAVFQGSPGPPGPPGPQGAPGPKVSPTSATHMMFPSERHGP